jgi:4'-phosphopantetheinyl transferase
MSVTTLPRPRAPLLEGAASFLSTVAGIDVWRIDLDRTVAAAAELLDAAERARAARFVFERDRARFATGRAALRAILAAYLGAEPAALAFTIGPHGKPALPDGPPFSFSNSQGCGLCAVGQERPVGVDVERLREVPDAAGVARSAFTPEERAAWQAAGAGGGAAFLRVWTRKEAALKALGLGLSALDRGDGPLRGVEVLDVPLDADHVAALAIVRADG